METVGTASSILKTISVGITVCEGLFFYLDSRKGEKPHIRSRLYSSVENLRKVFTLLNDLLRAFDTLDSERLQCVSTCLSGCKNSIWKLSIALEALLKHDEDPQDSKDRRSTTMRAAWLSGGAEKSLEANVLRTLRRLEPAVYILKLTKPDSNIATTSGFEKGKRNRFRRSTKHDPSHASAPAIGVSKTFPFAEEGKLAEIRSDVDSPSNYKEHCKPTPYTPGAGQQQPAHDPPASRGIASLRRIPFCYLLAALAFIFISSSSAVGLYYSIEQNAMGDGFTTAGFMLAVGTLVVTPPAAYHYQHCRCWRSDPKGACQEGVV